MEEARLKRQSDKLSVFRASIKLNLTTRSYSQEVTKIILNKVPKNVSKFSERCLSLTFEASALASEDLHQA